MSHRLALGPATILLAALVSGCVGVDAGPDPSVPAADDDQAAAGSIDEANEAEADNATSIDVDPVAQPVSGTGRTSQGVWVCAPTIVTGECVESTIDDGDYNVRMAWEGTVVQTRLEITWEATDPTLAEMVVLIRHFVDGEEVTNSMVEATSPYVFEDASRVDGPDAELSVGLWPVAKAELGDSSAFIDLTQADFEVAGTLWTIDIA